MGGSSEDANAELLELSKKYNECRQRLQQVTAQIAGRDQDKLRAALTGKEVDALPDGVRTYKAIGRAFLVADKTKLLDGLEATVVDAAAEITKLQGVKAQFEKQLQTLEKEITEVMAARQPWPWLAIEKSLWLAAMTLSWLRSPVSNALDTVELLISVVGHVTEDIMGTDVCQRPKY
eukprot:jgi/Mesvir1/19312/Mv10379-RA.1